ncbi:MAG: bifunctional diaminohydroxyphosphoribosylaminopyrimidine deaminase/5-amino-6-(5-phosphoribosylamino)uracil reductase RibD [Holophagaceae bacterium]|nr:bifunctional diaminohydroxyphosphoribosylaminopyrimidine deaminase/5-amino-6-(5-phosphoribosylamino)uracil reductase RibD [Holophagaceae bacterium]
MPELNLESAWEYATGGPWPKPERLSGDESPMAEAIQESLAGIGLSSPNPSVGCILVKDGRVIGRGHHSRAGGQHAEVLAFQDANFRGESTSGATAYITLEPCCHTGKTPPCTSAIIQSNIRRVVVGARDINPRVAGGGIAILRAKGIEVSEGVLGSTCAQLHAPFFKSMRTGLPWVMLKLALGSDSGIGKKGMKTNVTPPEVQGYAHALRRVCDGILVGRNTVAIDNPQLTDRWPKPTQPYRVFRRIVLDSHGSLSPDCRVWQFAEGHSAIRVLTEGAPPIDGVEDLRLPPSSKGCNLHHLLHELSLKGISRLLVEGGHTLASELLDADLVDVLHIFYSTKPAGGEPVILNTCKFDLHVGTLHFEDGYWQICQKNCNVAQ